jgi:hypothetical protein
MTKTSTWFGLNKRERAAVAAYLGTAGLPAQVAVAATVKTANYTLTEADAGHTIEVNSATGVTITVPANIFTAGQRVDIVQVGAGLVTMLAGAGFTLSSPTTLKAAGTWATLTVRFRSATAGVLAGNISAT